MKQNNENNENNDQTRKPRTVVATLLDFKDKQEILHETKSRNKFYVLAKVRFLV